MKSFKLLAALLPTLAVALNAAAQVSTSTVFVPVSTRTHTNTVYVTASLGPTYATCLIPSCASANASTSGLSTTRITSYTTFTTTTVVIPPDSTTNITYNTDKNVSTSCAMQTPSTITVTVTETSYPVITKSVYPIPAANATVEPSTSATSYSINPLVSTSKILPYPPYFNGSYANTTTNCTATTTEYVPLYTHVIGAVPDNVASTSATETGTTTLYPVNTLHGPINSTEGVFASSSVGRVQPLQLFIVLARFISAVDAIVVPTQESDISAHQDESRFCPYPASLNPGPPPQPTNTPRDVDRGLATESRILGTLTTTSTVTFTNTSVNTLTGSEPFKVVPGPDSKVTMIPVDSTLSLETSAMANSQINGTKSGNITSLSPSMPIFTVLTTVTVTSPVVTSTITLTTVKTWTYNVTSTVDKTITHTETVTTTPTSGSIVEDFSDILYYAILATWFVMFAMA